MCVKNNILNKAKTCHVRTINRDKLFSIITISNVIIDTKLNYNLFFIIILDVKTL